MLPYCSVNDPHFFFDRCHKLAELLKGGQLRIILLDLFGGPEQETCLAGKDHIEIVIAVSAGDGVEANGLQSLYRAEFGLLNAHLITGDLA